MLAHLLAGALLGAQPSVPLAPPPAPRAALPVPPPALPPAAPEPDPPRAVQRALALAAAGDPDVTRVQLAAARHAATTPEGHGALEALLPHLTAEVRHADESNRVVGLQGSGEVDYLRLSPALTVTVRATWDLGKLAPPPPPGLLEVARRREEAVAKATKVYFARRALRARLLLEPPADPAARAEAELDVDRMTAELDALTGGAFRWVR
ncbi:MAG: hypothetical protein U0229_12985 [Anaeromyxobacter sp.]